MKIKGVQIGSVDILDYRITASTLNFELSSEGSIPSSPTKIYNVLK